MREENSKIPSPLKISINFSSSSFYYYSSCMVCWLRKIFLAFVDVVVVDIQEKLFLCFLSFCIKICFQLFLWIIFLLVVVCVFETRNENLLVHLVFISFRCEY